MKLWHLEENLSKLLPPSLRWFGIKFVFGLYVQKISIKNSVFSSVEGMLLWHREEYLLHLNFYLTIRSMSFYPSILLYVVGNVESILVSEITSMSTLLCNISTSKSNLFVRKIILSCAIIILFGFFDLIFSIFQ